MNPIAFQLQTFDVALIAVVVVVCAGVALLVVLTRAQSEAKRKKSKQLRPRSLPPAWWRYTAIDELLLLYRANADGFKLWREVAGPFAAIMSKAAEQRTREYDELKRSGGLDTVWFLSRLHELQAIYRESSTGKIRAVDFTERAAATLSRALVGVAACMGADVADVLIAEIFSVGPWTRAKFPPASADGRAAEAAARARSADELIAAERERVDREAPFVKTDAMLQAERDLANPDLHPTAEELGYPPTGEGE